MYNALLAAAVDVARMERAPSGAPRFDLLLLGVGADGHVGSLYPGSAATLAEPSGPWVLPVVKEKPPASITLSRGVMNAARSVVVSGGGGWGAAGCTESAAAGMGHALQRNCNCALTVACRHSSSAFRRPLVSAGVPHGRQEGGGCQDGAGDGGASWRLPRAAGAARPGAGGVAAGRGGGG